MFVSVIFCRDANHHKSPNFWALSYISVAVCAHSQNMNRKSGKLDHKRHSYKPRNVFLELFSFFPTVFLPPLFLSPRGSSMGAQMSGICWIFIYCASHWPPPIYSFLVDFEFPHTYEPPERAGEKIDLLSMPRVSPDALMLDALLQMLLTLALNIYFHIIVLYLCWPKTWYGSSNYICISIPVCICDCMKTWFVGDATCPLSDLFQNWFRWCSQRSRSSWSRSSSLLLNNWQSSLSDHHHRHPEPGQWGGIWEFSDRHVGIQSG